jgi:NIPSNAP
MIMIFEMRQYLIERGRINDNHDRMQNHLPPLLAKHGIRVIGRWVALSGPRMPLFCYIMEWNDFGEREACWAAFYADPEWARVRAATNAGSELVEGQELVFLRPNPAFRQVDADLNRCIGGLHQIITQKTLIGQNPALADFLSATYFPRLRAAGAHIIGACDLISGPGMPATVMLFAWPDETVWAKGWRDFQNDAELLDAFRKQRAQYGTTLFGSNDTFLLDPAAYALPFASLRTRPR